MPPMGAATEPMPKPEKKKTPYAAALNFSCAFSLIIRFEIGFMEKLKAENARTEIKSKISWVKPEIKRKIPLISTKKAKALFDL